MKRKRVILTVAFCIVALATIYQIQRDVGNRRRNDSLNATYKKELAKLDSIGGLVTPAPAGGSRVVLPVKSLSAEWLADTEDSILLTLAASIVICGDANAPVVSKLKGMKWFDANKVEYSTSCP